VGALSTAGSGFFFQKLNIGTGIAENARMVAGKVRIIAGRFRGSKLDVPDAPGLRPTSDRVRETLFNWLQPRLPGARCLDLFAGSGALGFEAASRGAARVLMLERDARLAQSLRDTAARLRAEAVDVRATDALAWLRAPADAAFDIAFVDPPFDAGLHATALAALAPWLAPGALVYVEAPAGAEAGVPAGWTPHRAGRTREVEYALYATLAPASPAQVQPESR
jgi:16S rRNA (guanine966-N2)-methyltransferase